MILITTGTVSIPFKRLVENSIDIYENSTEKIIIQSGIYKIKKKLKKNFLIKDYFSHSEIVNLYKKANLIISAAGETSVFQILQQSIHKPILFPRQKTFKEHVDDQQVKIAEFFDKKNLVWSAYNSEDLELLCNKKPCVNTYQSAIKKNKLIKKLKTYT